ncbi:MAG TPA: hypothetical protein VMZ50_14165 [Phycisphaerae bacterium]|nr:hypothetical protein [Phycisphaerae bacterium]
MKFEHTTLDLDGWEKGLSGVDQLKSLGDEGWELVSVVESTAYLKRRSASPAPVDGLAKVCSNCECYEEIAEKDAEGRAAGSCSVWKMAMSGGAHCDQFAVKAYGESGPPESPFYPPGVPGSQMEGSARSAPGLSPPDDESPRHWRPQTEIGEKRIEEITSQDSGPTGESHKHRVWVILGSEGNVVRGRTDVVNGHAHDVLINGMAEEADGHTHTYKTALADTVGTKEFASINEE